MFPVKTTKGFHIHALKMRFHFSIAVLLSNASSFTLESMNDSKFESEFQGIGYFC